MSESVMTDDGEMICPACEHEWWDDDYFENGAGSEAECPKCEAQIECTDEDFTRHFYWKLATPTRREDGGKNLDSGDDR